MTRKDYELIARALHGACPRPWREPEHSTWRISVAAIADALASDNPRFDCARFIDACMEGE